MRKVWMAVVAASIAVAGIFGGVAIAGSKNDTVFHENEYHEYFKQEGKGDKNYLYTVTGITDPYGRKCTVITGASETAIAMDCINKAG